MLTLLLSLFGLIIVEGDIKGVHLHISSSETLSLNGKGIESITKGDTTFIYLDFKQDNLFNTLGIGLERIEIGLPEEARIEITSERSWIEIGKGLKAKDLELSVKLGGFRIDLRETPGDLRNFRIHSFSSIGEIIGLGDAGLRRFNLNSAGSKIMLGFDGRWESGARFNIFSSLSYLKFIIPEGLGIISNYSRLNSSGIPIVRIKIEGGLNRMKIER